MRGFGEIAVIKEDNNIKGKLSNKGLVVILVGFSTKHGRGTYRFLNINSKRIIYSRDIVWTDKYYGEFFKVKEVDKVVKMDMEFYRHYFEPTETYGNKKMIEIKNLEYENKEMRGGKTRLQSRMECVEIILVTVNDSVE